MFNWLLATDIIGGSSAPEDMPISTELDFLYPGLFLIGYILGILTVIAIIIAKRSIKNNQATNKSQPQKTVTKEHD